MDNNELIGLYFKAQANGWLTNNECRFVAAKQYAELHPETDWTEAEDALDAIANKNMPKLG